MTAIPSDDSAVRELPVVGSGIPLSATPAEALAVVRRIREEFIRTTPHLEPGCILGATSRDLERLYGLYDREVFRGYLARRLAERGRSEPPIVFSRRLTSSAGRTVTHRWPDALDPSAPPVVLHRIEISVPLVLDAFGAGAGDARVGGIVCRDRLDLVQRILEHEMVHLLELLAWDHTDCGGPSFLHVVSRLFGHTVASHGLATRRDLARAELGLRVGDRVAFDFEGVRREGRIRSIRRRATVLVEEPCPHGGVHRLAKYHVPLPFLRRADP